MNLDDQLRAAYQRRLTETEQSLKTNDQTVIPLAATVRRSRAILPAAAAIVMLVLGIATVSRLTTSTEPVPVQLDVTSAGDSSDRSDTVAGGGGQDDDAVDQSPDPDVVVAEITPTVPPTPTQTPAPTATPTAAPTPSATPVSQETSVTSGTNATPAPTEAPNATVPTVTVPSTIESDQPSEPDQASETQAENDQGTEQQGAPTVSPAVTAIAAPTPTTQATPAPAATIEPTPTATSEPTPLPTATPSATPEATATVTPTPTPSYASGVPNAVCPSGSRAELEFAALRYVGSNTGWDRLYDLVNEQDGPFYFGGWEPNYPNQVKVEIALAEPVLASQIRVAQHPFDEVSGTINFTAAGQSFSLTLSGTDGWQTYSFDPPIALDELTVERTDINANIMEVLVCVQP